MWRGIVSYRKLKRFREQVQERRVCQLAIFVDHRLNGGAGRSSLQISTKIVSSFLFEFANASWCRKVKVAMEFAFPWLLLSR
jgi:hypothetical protein